MITIKIKQTWTDVDISIKGHANYDTIGKDIVCSAISTLYQTMALSVDKLTDSIIYESSRSGDARLHISGLDEYSRILVESFTMGCESVAMAYPGHVEVYHV